MSFADSPFTSNTGADKGTTKPEVIAVPTADVVCSTNGGADLSVGDGRLEECTLPAIDAGPRNPVVLILCGLIASGKSTFAESLQAHFPEFKRCSQDDLGDRRKVEQLARESLGQGLSVCIDRTNFNASQRFHWIKIAREFPGTQIWVIVFDTLYEVCAARLQERTGHPTITTPEQGLAVLSRFASNFEPPRSNEGYDRILYLKLADHPTPEYTAIDISLILERVRNSAPVSRPPPGRHGDPATSSSPGFAGYQNGPRPYRSRGRGYPYPEQGGGGSRGGGPGHNANRQGPMAAEQGRWQGGRGYSPQGWRGAGAPGYRTDGQRSWVARGGKSNAGREREFSAPNTRSSSSGGSNGQTPGTQ